ncbi:MAG TPA: tryptophan--tRNA ligase [Bdellovibrionota bacterium]|jgi:tryptophanyl-tRNA synthetase|nr:tryptophan--tRNA ligase [Bdellovibrionota bacterium]
MKDVMLSAIQPTNQITLGNYLGAIKNWVKYQSDYDSIFFVVDLHSITVRQDPKELREATYRGLATYIAAGLDPDKCLLFAQSHVPAHAELGWVLNCFTYMGELNRMTQYKDKSAKQGANIPVGLFGYPVLMAADILLYGAKKIPVGDDQKQHVELTRDIAIRMNNVYGDLFTVPEPMIPPVGARIMDLQNPTAKMSKSAENDNGTVFMFDTDKDIEKKIKRAVTDSGTEIAFSDDKPGVKNLLSIQSAITGRATRDLVEGYVGKQYGHLKVETAEIVVNALRPIREEAQRLLSDRGELDRILALGAAKARERAAPTLKRVYEAVGFLPAIKS